RRPSIAKHYAANQHVFENVPRRKIGDPLSTARRGSPRTAPRTAFRARYPGLCHTTGEIDVVRVDRPDVASKVKSQHGSNRLEFRLATVDEDGNPEHLES